MNWQDSEILEKQNRRVHLALNRLQQSIDLDMATFSRAGLNKFDCGPTLLLAQIVREKYLDGITRTVDGRRKRWQEKNSD